MPYLASYKVAKATDNIRDERDRRISFSSTVTRHGSDHLTVYLTSRTNHPVTAAQVAAVLPASVKSVTEAPYDDKPFDGEFQPQRFSIAL